MKPRLSRILLTALLAAQCSTMAYAVVQPDGIDHTLTENTALSTETDKVYDVNVTIGGRCNLLQRGWRIRQRRRSHG